MHTSMSLTYEPSLESLPRMIEGSPGGAPHLDYSPNIHYPVRYPD